MATLDQVIEGLKILAKYTHNGTGAISAQHDIIYAGPDSRTRTHILPEEDAKALEALGWHFSEGESCWARFV